MPVPEKKEVVEAILTFSPSRLESLIQKGAPVHEPLFECDGLVIHDASDPQGFQDEDMVGLIGDSFLYPLHLAVVCAYFYILS